MDRWEVEKKAVIKSLKNPAFRKKLLSNPKQALHEIDPSLNLGSLHIHINEENPNEWILSLPPAHKKWENMTESELEKLLAGCDCDYISFSF